jgi:hypothetical protein
MLSTKPPETIMNVEDRFWHDEPQTDDFPTLCSVPLRPEWFDDAERLEPVIVRGTD